MRLNQYVARASGLSRRAADAAITAARVTLNGVVASLGQSVEPSDQVALDGKLLAVPDAQAIILHKPAGYVTSRRQQGKTPTIYSLLPPELYSLKPVGRLDRDSSGLLLLTNDGVLAQAMQHPSSGKWKRYIVKLNRDINDNDINKLERGVKLSDGLSRLHLARVGGKRRLEVRLQEGRNRQIRRSFDAVGYRVVTLHRTDFGDLSLGQIKPGEWQTITIESA